MAGVAWSGFRQTGGLHACSSASLLRLLSDAAASGLLTILQKDRVSGTVESGIQFYLPPSPMVPENPHTNPHPNQPKVHTLPVDRGFLLGVGGHEVLGDSDQGLHGSLHAHACL